MPTPSLCEMTGGPLDGARLTIHSARRVLNARGLFVEWRQLERCHIYQRVGESDVFEYLGVVEVVEKR